MNGPENPGPPSGASAAGASLAGKWAAGLFSATVLLLAFSPVLQNWRAKPKDDFPLSYYPMFTENRAPTVKVSYLVGVDAQGGRHKLPYTFAGSGGLNQVRRQINRRLDNDEEDKLCRSVAERVAKKGKGWVTNIVSVEVRTDTYHLGGYFSGTNRAPVREKVHGTCKVRRDKEP